MARFVSFDGNSMWWNVDLFHTIGVGYGKYGLIENGKPDDVGFPGIMGLRSDEPHTRLRHESIIVFTGQTESQCYEVLDLYHETIKELPPLTERLSLENGDLTYNSDLFHRIEIVSERPYDGHNNVEWSEHEILGRYIDPKNSEWYGVELARDSWYGSELLFCSQIYGECEQAAKECEHLITLKM